MKTKIKRLFGYFERKNIEREIESELHFHLESLTEQYLGQGLTLKEAEMQALKRFGDVDQIKNQCLEISRKNHPLVRALKCFLVIIFLAGVSARIFSADIYGKQIGNMLITISALSGLLLYLRILDPTRFVPNNKTWLSLSLNDNGQIPISGKDQLTPVERVIAGE